MPPSCAAGVADMSCVCEFNGAVWIGVGYEAEDEPREWFGMSVQEARDFARHVEEAAAMASEHST